MPPIPLPPEPAASFGDDASQRRFHRRWGHLQDPHVRALAWLLDAPDLLDAGSPQWHGRIASLTIDVDSAEISADSSDIATWLTRLDANPEALHASLDLSTATRLGRYAEKLLAYYFTWRGTLFAHGLQVRMARQLIRTGQGDQAEIGRSDRKGGSGAFKRGETVGEFDFLLWDERDLLHLELATKFYLFEEAPGSDAGQDFIGPNLADTLGAKMDKILNRQLALARHPAAQDYLPQPVARSQALIKGWLFYPVTAALPGPQQMHGNEISRQQTDRGSPGVASDHCRGVWCSLHEFATIDAQGFLLLPRLAWLAPARSDGTAILAQDVMREQLALHFAIDTMPMLIALMEYGDGSWREVSRCFVVPDDWRKRVHERNQRTVLRLENSN